MSEKWAKIESIYGINLFVKFDSEKIYEITSREPHFAAFEDIDDKFAYIAKYLKDHRSQPFLLEALDDLDFSWVTPFQLSVYRALAIIPAGTKISYGELAKMSGHPNAARAVGSAMAKNRFLIVVPCHRVIASDGKIGGFSSGIELKKLLLAAEIR